MCERYARKPDMHTKTVAQKRGKEDYEEKVIVGNISRFYGDGEYYGTAEPPVRCGESHLSGLTEPLHFVY